MAFKATRKPATKKTTKEASPVKRSVVPEEIPLSAPEPEVVLSIEDLVGAPKGVDEVSISSPSPVVIVSEPSQSPVQRPMYAPYGDRGNYAQNQGNDRGRREYARNGNNRGGYGQRSQQSQGGGYGYNRGNQSGGYSGGNRDFRRGGQQGYSRDAGYRRDDGYRRDFQDQGSGASRFNEAGTGSFTSDADVPTETVRGVLDTMPDGHGFLRPKYTPSERDVYISQSQIRRFVLRNGDMVEGQARPPKDNERYWGLLKVEKVNELLAEQMEKRPRFEDLVPVYPNKQLRLETGSTPLSTRIIDLLAPIGFGQRGLVVSPPKAGKTTVLKELAAGISANYPDVHLMAVLIGERPEEVTDITRNVHGEVYASNFDESPEHQTRVAEVALDRAKRLIEMGHDVVILLDSITRLARAYNLVVNPSGRTLTGGFDPAALYPAKKFLGAARCNEPFLTPEEQAKVAIGETPIVKRVTDGGSLKIIGKALVETGRRMDDLIYEEFKGTGNMELHLSRALQERRVFPAIDAGKSGTRHDELLLGEDAMKKVTTLRHMLSLLSDEERTQMLIDRLGKTKDNAEFLESLSQG